MGGDSHPPALQFICGCESHTESGPVCCMCARRVMLDIDLAEASQCYMRAYRCALEDPDLTDERREKSRKRAEETETQYLIERDGAVFANARARAISAFTTVESLACFYLVWLATLGVYTMFISGDELPAYYSALLCREAVSVTLKMLLESAKVGRKSFRRVLVLWGAGVLKNAGVLGFPWVLEYIGLIPTSGLYLSAEYLLHRLRGLA